MNKIKLLTTKQTAKILDVHVSTVSHLVSPHHRISSSKGGIPQCFYMKEKVLQIKTKRDAQAKKQKKKRMHTKIYHLSNSYDFEVDRLGNKIPRKLTYRGSVCRDCKVVPVPTGYLYCPDCKKKRNSRTPDTFDPEEAYGHYIR